MHEEENLLLLTNESKYLDIKKGQKKENKACFHQGGEQSKENRYSCVNCEVKECICIHVYSAYYLHTCIF